MKYQLSTGEFVDANFDFFPFIEHENYTILKSETNKSVISNEIKLPKNYPTPYFINTTWLTGYVVFHHSEIPKDFAYGYNCKGMSFLNIHGGITYQGVISSDNEKRKKLDKEFANKMSAFLCPTVCNKKLFTPSSLWGGG